MSPATDARNINSHDVSGDEQALAATRNKPTSATGLTGQARARYEQVQAEINALIWREEAREREKSESTKRDSAEDDWLLTLLPL